MYNIYNIVGITFLVFSLISAFFAQEELMISCGIVALYCGMKQIEIKKEQEIITNNV